MQPMWNMPSLTRDTLYICVCVCVFVDRFLSFHLQLLDSEPAISDCQSLTGSLFHEFKKNSGFLKPLV